MGVIRVEHNANYTTMSNYHLRDKRLSLRAMGLMSKMLSLPDDWDYTVVGLASICKEGRDAVRKALQELEAAGYLIREQGRSKGNFSANNYTLYEQPGAAEADRASPLTENPSTVNPSTGKPSTGNPSTGNPTQLKDVSNKKTKVINNNTTTGEKAKEQKHAFAATWEPELFERFWKMYPCKKDKVGARREWDKLKPDRKLMVIMSAALKRAIASDEWQRGIGIPYACRWLSHRRWEDGLDAGLPDSGEAPEALLLGERC